MDSSSNNINNSVRQIRCGTVITCAADSSAIPSPVKSFLPNHTSSGDVISTASPLSVSPVDSLKKGENRPSNSYVDKFPTFLTRLSDIAAKQLKDLGQSHQDANKDFRNGHASTINTSDPNARIGCTKKNSPKRKTSKSAASCKKGSTSQRDKSVPTKVGSLTSSPGVRGKQKEKRQRPKPRKDRAHLRKGKWTVEEEEYTSRIIHYFRAGLLTLPEGMTLRSYLASKLTCDPMRITKKFAGASCLGKRIYHLCERSQITMNDIDIARIELAQLEQRFRLRVEHGQSGLPLPPRVGGSILDHSGQSLVNGIMHGGHCAAAGSEAAGHVWPSTFTTPLAPPNLNTVVLNPLLLQAIACQQQQQQQQQNAVPWLAMQTPLNLALLTNLIISAQQGQKPAIVSPDLFHHHGGLSQPQGIAPSNPQVTPHAVDIQSQQLHAINSNSTVGSLLKPSGTLHKEMGKQLQSTNNIAAGSLLPTSGTLHNEMEKQVQQVQQVQQVNNIIVDSVLPTSGVLYSETGKKNTKPTEAISCEPHGLTRAVPSKDAEIRKRVDDQLPCKRLKVNIQNNAGQGHTQEDEDAGRTLLEFLRELQKNHSIAVSEDRSQRSSVEEVNSTFGPRDTNLVLSSDPKIFVDGLPRRNTQFNKSVYRNDASVVTASINDSVTSRGSISPMKNSGNSSMQGREVAMQDYETSSTLSAPIFKTSDISDSRGGNESSSYSESNMEQNSEESDSSKSHLESSEGAIDKENLAKGPVRKRFKRSAFTSRNVEDHNNRMEALRKEDVYSKRF